MKNVVKTVVNLSTTASGNKFRVKSLTNRLEPAVGVIVTKEEVEALLSVARTSRTENLTVNIK